MDWILLHVLVRARSRAQCAPYPMDEQVRSADSIMGKVIFFAPLYERIVESYRAGLYIKGRVNIRKKNHFLRYIPSMFRPKRG
ncbi:hypothetical protein [Bacteroides sp. 272]|uniref:hypothetical protein n=1 Tax=Bacteroides sp. 272 TaxID=3157352 RepID=UPI004062BFA0